MIVTVGPKGRVVIPFALRRELGIGEGTELAALREGDGVLLMPRDAIKRRLRQMFADLESSMADELLADRRIAAREESTGS